MIRIALLSVVIAAAGAQSSSRPPYSPSDALAMFRIEPGFRIELMASEPDVQSPVAMDIDEHGRWFVVEMPGYPVDTTPSGRIRLLVDTNGDGRPDRSSVFADNLVMPNGVMRWKKGILVTAAPDVLYLEDTNDDGIADVRKVVVTGFAFTNPQHMVNSPVYGLDNWIYLAHEGAAGAIIYADLFGDRGKPLTFPDSPGTPPLDQKNRSVRIRPDTHQFEILSGRSQFGHSFDAWGHYFTSSNNDHIRHEVIAARYLDRAPHLPVATAMPTIADHGGAAKVFPITDRPNYELLTESGEFTSACSLTVYGGGRFPGEFGRSTFVAEPVHNIVHRDVLEPSGATFIARRGGDGREFLASTDAWFRPVNFYIGPDGALYVIDYYRARIEHPEWTASEFHKDPSQFTLGRDRGRIYRITPEGEAPAGAVRLDASDEAALVAALANPNIWWRRTAQRLIVEHPSATVLPRLEALAQEATALGRLHALWTLDGLARLDDDLVLRALGDPEAGVRENALRLAESRVGASDVLRAAVLARAIVETDPRTQFQLLATLGGIDTPESRTAQQRLLFDHLEDPWMQLAGLSAGPDRAAMYLRQALGPRSGILSRDSAGHRGFIALAASVVAAEQPDEIAHLTARAAADSTSGAAWWEAALLEGLARSARGSGTPALADSRAALVVLAERDDAAVRRNALALLAVAGLGDAPAAQAAAERARRRMADADAAAERRADAIALAALGGVERIEPQLLGLIVPREPEIVQVAALRALSGRAGEALGREILARWPTLTPGARSAAVDLLLADRARQLLLVEALRTGALQTWAMSFNQKRRLIMHRDPGIREQARALLEDRPDHRAEVVNRYAAAAERGGDPVKGEQVFTRICAACHKLGAVGSAELGPDLSGVRHRPPLALLVDILAPNQSIAQGYETYTIERADGRTEAGTLAEQTPSAITLRQAGRPLVIPRREIARIAMLPQSSMPADLDKVIPPDQMADLLAFLTRR